MNRNRAFFLLLLAVVGTLSLFVALPFYQYVLLGVLFAYVLHPLHRRLAPRVGPRLSAGVLIVATVFTVLLPVVVLASVVVGQALTVTTAIRNGQFNVDIIEAYIQTYFGVVVDIRELLESLTSDGRAALFDSVLDVFGGLSHAAIGLAVLLFVLYYLLKDGHRLVAWIRVATPLPEDVLDDLFTHLDRLMWAVLVGNVLVGIVQGVLTGIGFFAVGLPNVIFWTVMTATLSLLPLIGASVVWIPASLYLLFVGDTTAGVLLFAYGALVVSLSDNYLRPLIGGHEAKLNPGLFIVGIFGGIAAFGFVGLFYGPIVLGTLKALIDIYSEVGDRLQLMDSAGETTQRE
ncbi:Predicted PurR-regulated permease PerM [Halogranum rubrum]|uniref:Predicted PurR-regulated permease PerM n=1 Tax=Halogranum rubrum TaxID=553466 RepID=A0A1I4IPP3_9EURY|nr:AI-2E family transporter [Halogranum rubrum]SFL56359.1 Predicted PurR-regulated permease PerM [Halogranum rubrum]